MSVAFHDIQTNFLGGEITPFAYGRIDTDLFNNSARLIKNFIIAPQGGARFRHGFAYAGDTSSASYVLPRIFTVSRGGIDDDLVLELGFQPGNTLLDNLRTILVRPQFYTASPSNHLTMLLCSWPDGTNIIMPVSTEQPSVGFSMGVMAQSADVVVGPDGTGTFPLTTVKQGTNALFVWNGSSWGISNDYVPLTAYATLWSPDSTAVASTFAATVLPVPPITTRDLLFMTDTQKGRLMEFAMPDGPPLYLQVNSIWNSATWQQIPAIRIPTLKYRDDKSPGAADSEVDIQFGPSPAWTNSDNFWVAVNGISEGRTIFGQPVQPWTYPYSTDVPTMTARLLQAFQNNPEVANDQVTVAHQSGTTWRITLEDESSSVDITVGWVGSGTEKPATTVVNATGSNTSEPAWSYPTVVFQGANYYRALQPNLNQTPPNATYWEDLGTTKPVWFDWQYPNGNAWSASNYYGVGDRGFPRAATFHDQRLVLGGNKDAPLNIWGSKIGDFDLFFTESVNDDDPWAFTLDSMDSPEVQFLTSNKGLFCGSTNGDWIINADVTITPTDIFASRQTARRAALAKPIVLGNEVFYIQNGRTKIRRSAYVRDSDGFRTEDFTLASEHLFRDPILRIDKLVSPETFIWAVNDQGALRGCTYDKFAGAQAWHRHETDGIVSDITGAFLTLERGVGDPQFSAGIDNLVIIVQRLVDDQYKWLIETMPYPSFRPERGNYQGSVHADSYVEFFHSPAATSSEAKNLARRDVRLIGIPDGETDLRDYGTVTVNNLGICTYPTALTYAAYGLPYEGLLDTSELAMSPEGSAMGHSRRWDELYMKITDSYAPEVRTTEDGDWQQPNDGDYVIGQPMPQKFSGDIKVHELGYGQGIVSLRHTRPIPCNVTTLFGRVAAYDVG